MYLNLNLDVVPIVDLEHDFVSGRGDNKLPIGHEATVRVALAVRPRRCAQELELIGANRQIQLNSEQVVCHSG